MLDSSTLIYVYYMCSKWKDVYEIVQQKVATLSIFYPWLILLVVMLVSKIKPYACL